MDGFSEHDVVATGSVAIAGLMALISELATARLLAAPQVKAIGDFMLDATGRSAASPELQAHLHEALSAHFAPLLAALAERDSSSPAPEG